MADAMSIRESSLLGMDVTALKTLLANWANSVLAGPLAPGQAPPEPVVTDLGGRRNSFRDGVALANIWHRLTGTKPAIVEPPTKDADLRTNWRVLLAQLESAKVKPLHASHIWDAALLVDGDVASTITLVAGVAAHFGVPIPRDVYFWDDGGDPEAPLPRLLTASTATSPRQPPLLFAKVYKSGVYKGQTAVFRRGDNVVGRLDSEDGDVLIDDKSVSAEHCRIIFDGSNFVVEDAGSTHGTIAIHPWSSTRHKLGSKDARTGKRHVLWRGTELCLGDSHLVVVHIESTAFYSDYPLLGAPPGLNLDIIVGPPYEGMTTIGVHHPGVSYGAGPASEPAEDEGLAELGIMHATMPGLEDLHASIIFSAFLGRYMFANYTDEACFVSHARSPELARQPVLRGCMDVVEAGDELYLGSAVAFRAIVVPPRPQ